MRSLSGCEMLEKHQMEEIIRPLPFKPWKLMLDTEALDDKTPGTLIITAAKLECCLVREPKELQQSASTKRDALKQEVDDFPQEMQGILGALLEHMQDLTRKCDGLAQRVEALESTK